MEKQNNIIEQKYYVVYGYIHSYHKDKKYDKGRGIYPKRLKNFPNFFFTTRALQAKYMF